jgi:hypothetical protein
MFDQADVEACQWEAFLATLERCFYGDPFTAGDIAALCAEKTLNADTRQVEHSARAAKLRGALPDDISEALDRPGHLQRRLGRALAARAQRRYGDYGVHLARDGERDHVALWKVMDAPKSEGLAA